MANSGLHRFWPKIDSKENAVEVMHYGMWAALFTVVVNTVISCVAIIKHHPVLGFNAGALVDALIFAVIAWRIYRLSLPWTVIGLLFFTAEKIYEYATNPAVSHSSPVVGIILFLAYVNAVRGGFYLRRAEAQAREATAGESPHQPIGSRES